MKFSKKKAPIKLPHPTINLIIEGYISDDGVWSIHKEDTIAVAHDGKWVENFWVLSHLPSGAKMPWEFNSKKQAHAFCIEVSPLADWKNLRTKVVDGKMKVLPETTRKIIGRECTQIYKRMTASN